MGERSGALVSRRTYIIHHGQKIDITDGVPAELRNYYGDDLRNLTHLLFEEIWDTKHPECPFVKAADSPKSENG